MKQVKSVAYYLLHNMGDKTYGRVLAAFRKYPNASLYELQHGVNSAASQKYRERHVPEIERGYGYEELEEGFEPEYVPEPEKPALRIFCFRDYLGADRYSYYGVNLYFVERVEQDYFYDVQRHFKEEMETFMPFDYDETALSECEPDDVGTADPDGLKEHDFVFEISDIKRQTFAYWGHFTEGHFTPNLHMFDAFDMQTLTMILRSR